MTDAVGVRPVLVLDASVLVQPVQVDRLDVLGDYLAEWQCLTTRVVLQEVSRLTEPYGVGTLAAASWLHEVRLDNLDDFPSLIKWSSLMGSGQHHRGEATAAACADLNSGTVAVDDRRAKAVIRQHGLRAIGTLGLIAEAIKSGRTSELGCSGFIDALSAAGKRLPCDGRGFPVWARRRGLLP
jgi:predicted nucleic acid-binding protein